MTALHVTDADLRAQEGYTASPPQECLNGCESQQGDARSKVFCEPRHLLCPKCAARLTKWLRDLPTTYALLPSVIEHGTVPADPGTKHTKRPDPPAPMRLEVIDLLDTRPGFGALGILHSWAQVVREERLQPANCTCGHLALGHRSYGPVRCTAKKCQCGEYRAIPPTVTAECQLLVSNLPWIVEQGFAGDLYEEIRVLQRTLTDTVGDYRAKPVGKCARLVDRPGVPLQVTCEGALLMDKEGHGVHCVTCGARHEANAELRELGLIVGALIREDEDTTSRRQATAASVAVPVCRTSGGRVTGTDMPPRKWGVNGETAPIAEVSTTGPLDEIRELERQWTLAATHYSPKAWPAECKAWDAMAEAKRAAGLCIDPGCRAAPTETTDRCVQHRVRGHA